MPLHDHQCEWCGCIHEEFVAWNERTCGCPICGETSHRVYLQFKGIKHDSPDWLKDTLQVVDKDGGQHCRDFLKNPSRANYQSWMKGEGIRPMEEGEGIKNKKKVDTAPIRKRVKENFKKKNSIEVRGM